MPRHSLNMNAVPPKKRTNKGTKPLFVTKGTERLLRTIHFYRFMSASHVAALLYSLSSLTYVRSLLSELAGGQDFRTHQYLYRFPLPNTSTGNTQKVYTLGSRGRDFIAQDLGLPIDWYFRPSKTKHLSYGQVQHNLILTGFCVAATRYCRSETDLRLVQTRLCYDLSRKPAHALELGRAATIEKLKVVPDAWLLFEKLKDGDHQHWFPILLEIDRGMEYQQKFKQHVRARIQFVLSGAYSKMFGTKAVIVAYITTGDLPEYRQTRRQAMCKWTKEVLAELKLENWSHIFRFASVQFDRLYTSPIFAEPLWYTPDPYTQVRLFDEG